MQTQEEKVENTETVYLQTNLKEYSSNPLLSTYIFSHMTFFMSYMIYLNNIRRWPI